MDETERLNDLIARCEKASEGSDALDLEVAKATYASNWGDVRLAPPKFTQSVDAILDLVPEAAYPGVVRKRSGWEGYVHNGEPHTVGMGGMTRNPNMIWQTSRAATPALALTAAALKYRAAVRARLPQPAKES